MRRRRSGSLTAIGASEVESTPAAIAESVCPSWILFARVTKVSRLVAHACWRSKAGVRGSSAEPSTASRVRLKSRECLSTAPPPTLPRRSPARPKRATSPSIAAVSMSWLLALAYALPARPKGMRLPPRIIARRGPAARGEAAARAARGAVVVGEAFFAAFVVVFFAAVFFAGVFLAGAFFAGAFSGVGFWGSTVTKGPLASLLGGAAQRPLCDTHGT